MKTLLSLVAFLPFAAAVADAELNKPAALMQQQGLSSAVAGCYVDTPAWDVARAHECFAVTSKRLGTSSAVFSVLGIDQTGGRYQLNYLDNTCSSVFYTTNEGTVCLRPIRTGQTLTQRVRVTDLQTGSAVVLSASATYEYEPMF